MKFTFDKSGKTLEEITKAAESIGDYVTSFSSNIINKRDYDNAETSINLSFDSSIYERCQSLSQKLVSKKLKYIIVIGIGGANLGPKAIYDALHGSFDTIELDRVPRMLFADTIDPEYLSKLVSFLRTSVTTPEEIIINVISKSGGTTETVVNLECIIDSLKETFPTIKDRLVVTTTPQSTLDTIMKKLGVTTLIHEAVGGRYSVLSSVGVFPLLCAGIDVKALLKGAQTSRDLCITLDPAANPALASATLLYLHSKDGKNINDNFLFHTELESLGKWYRQLMGESIGKEHDMSGAVARAGITPTVSIGSTDLHSMAQLYFGGPRDKITTFVTTQKTTHDVTLPSTLMFGGLVKNIEGRKASEIMRAISDATKISYAHEGMPYMDVVLNEINEFSLGEFMQFKMIEMMFLGKLFNVNTFDQPHVEIYKKELKRIMAGE